MLFSSDLYIFAPRIQDRELFRRNFNAQDRLRTAFLRIKITHQELSAWRRGAKMYKAELEEVLFRLCRFSILLIFKVEQSMDPQFPVLAYYIYTAIEDRLLEVARHQEFLRDKDITCRAYISE